MFKHTQKCYRGFIVISVIFKGHESHTGMIIYYIKYGGFRDWQARRQERGLEGHMETE